MVQKLKKVWTFSFVCILSCFVYGYIFFSVSVRTNKNDNITHFKEEISTGTAVQERNDTTALENVVIREPCEIQGPGGNGSGVNISHHNLSSTEKEELKAGQKKHRFNTFISDLVSVHRKLPDMRSSECKRLHYPDNLPAASIIIIFRDELLSILLRTIYSVLETTPDHLITEVILVDDGSTLGELSTKLDVHVKSLPKVSLIRHNTSKGLMVARQTGIEKSRSEFFVVMDSHMEVATGWLEPLIHRLIEKPKALLCSKMGSISSETFRVKIGHGRSSFIGFNYMMAQSWMKYDKSYLEKHGNITEPIESAMVQGMFIAMRKEFFLQLGGFDTGMETWGAEQMELSIKVTKQRNSHLVPLLDARYIQTPWSGNSTKVTKNRLRVADVWLDEYKDGIFHMQKHKKINYGNIEDRRKIRVTNDCKPFQYFLDKLHELSQAVYFPLKPKARGRVRNLIGNYCLSAGDKPDYRLSLSQCRYQSRQYFILTEMSDFRFKSKQCLISISNSPANISLQLKDCSQVSGKNLTQWTLQKDKTLRNKGKCLTAETHTSKVLLEKCNGEKTQQWAWEW